MINFDTILDATLCHIVQIIGQLSCNNPFMLIFVLQLFV